MVVDLIAETSVSDLVQALKMIEAYGVAVWHEQAMEGNRQAALPKAFDLPGLTEEFRACGDKKPLAIVGVDIIREQACDGAGHLPIESVDQYGFKYGSFKQDVGLACRGGGKALGFLLSFTFRSGIFLLCETGSFSRCLDLRRERL